MQGAVYKRVDKEVDKEVEDNPFIDMTYRIVDIKGNWVKYIDNSSYIARKIDVLFDITYTQRLDEFLSNHIEVRKGGK